MLEHQRGQRASLAVEGNGLREVAVGHAVAGEHGEGLREEIPRQVHAAGGAQRRLLDEIAHGYAEGRAVAEIGLNALRQVHEGRADLRDAVAL